VSVSSSLFGALKIAAIAGVLPALLAACSSTSTGQPSETERSVTERIFFSTTKLPEQKADAREYGCPAANILDGTVAYRVGDASAARGISHQAAIHDIARECNADGGMMRIKVGVQGRLLLGDSGRPGTFTIPVRVAVRSNGQTISSKLVSTTVTIGPDQGQVPFVVIDDSISVPITAEDPGEAYSILVGLDPQATRNTGRRNQRRR
jgi:hypothetical protein